MTRRLPIGGITLAVVAVVLLAFGIAESTGGIEERTVPTVVVVPVERTVLVVRERAAPPVPTLNATAWWEVTRAAAAARATAIPTEMPTPLAVARGETDGGGDVD